MKSRLLLAAICCAALGLGACGGFFVVDRPSDGGAPGDGPPQAEPDRLRDRLAAERAALEAARIALIDADSALLDLTAGGAGARTRLSEALDGRSRVVEAAAAALAPADGESGARAASRDALEKTQAALAALAEAVRTAGPAAASAPQAATAHTALGRAETAVETALSEVRAALALLDEMPSGDDAVGDALEQAQNALVTARLSLVPAIRRELREAQDALAAAERARGAAQSARDAALANVERLNRELAVGNAALGAAQTRITELEGRLADALARVAELERQLKAANDDAAALREQLADANDEADRLRGLLDDERDKVEALETERDELQTERDRLRQQLDDKTLAFGENVEPPRGNPAGSRVERTWRVDLGSADFPDSTLRFHLLFDPKVGRAAADRTRYSIVLTGPNPADASAYAPGWPAVRGHAGNSPTILGTDAPATTEFPGRGTVLRSGLRAIRAHADATYAGATAGVSAGDRVDASAVGGYLAKNRLIVQGQRTAVAADPGYNTGGAGSGLVRAGDTATVLYKDWDAKPQASFRYYDDERGFTMRFGGTGAGAGVPAADSGALVFSDLVAFPPRSGVGSDLDRDNLIARDIEVSFGEPSPDPHGERGYWWQMEVESALLDIERRADGNPVTTTVVQGNHPWRDGDGSAPLTDGEGQPLYVSLTDDPPGGERGGAYEALLFNHVGAGAGTDGEAGTDDDEQRWLKYAAYGLFRYEDYNRADNGSDRLHAFHYGFDAFDANSATATPALPGSTGASIAAVFAGRTSGWILKPYSPDATHGVERLSNCGSAGTSQCPSNYIDRAVRLRGDVALAACIGGTGCTGIDATDPNTVAGAIDGLEYSPGPGVGWTDRSSSTVANAESAIHGALNLRGAIRADGSYSGTVTPNATPELEADGDGMTAMSDRWAAGEFEGAFYGPRSALETAGTWWAPGKPNTEDLDDLAGMVGSFGAACTSGCADQ